MTRERAKLLLPLITAWAEGKTIEIKKSGGGWLELDSPMFSDNASEYRIKEENIEKKFCCICEAMPCAGAKMFIHESCKDRLEKERRDRLDKTIQYTSPTQHQIDHLIKQSETNIKLFIESTNFFLDNIKETLNHKCTKLDHVYRHPNYDIFMCPACKETFKINK